MTNPDVDTYAAEVRAALAALGRASLLAELERVSGSAPPAEAREASTRIGELLDEAFDEVDAARRAAGRSVPKRGNAP